MNRMKRIGALLLSAVLICSTAMVVSAHTDSQGALPLVDDGLSKITLHKYDLQNEDDDALPVGDGSVLSNTDPLGTSGLTLDDFLPMPNVQFIVELELMNTQTGAYEKVTDPELWEFEGRKPTINGVDMNTGTNHDDNWVATTHNDQNIVGYSAYTSATAPIGVITYENLRYGRYAFYEMEQSEYTRVSGDPFYVYVPTQLSTETVNNMTVTNWLYDIHVYPKNKIKPTMNKRMLDNVQGHTNVPDMALDGGVGPVGNQFVWEIEFELKDLNNRAYINIQDELDARLIYAPGQTVLVQYAPSNTTPKADRETLSGAQVGVTEPTAANNNRFSFHLGRAATINTGPFTANTLLGDLVSASNPSAGWLYITFTTLITTEEVPAADDVELVNQANAYWSDNPDPGTDPPTKPPGTTTPGKEDPDGDNSRTDIGTIEITKEAEDTGDKLGNAKFMLFKTRAAADLARVAGTNYVPTDSNCVVANNGATGQARYLFTTNNVADDPQEGMVFIRNIMSYHKSSADPATETYFTYWLVEVEAPPGYNVLTQPIEIEFESGSEKKVELTIKNGTGFTLPPTGGYGTLVFTVVGLTLITIAGIIYIRYRRRTHNNDIT